MSIQGHLSSISLPDLLLNLEQNGRTGTLSLRGPRAEDGVEVYFSDGAISMLQQPDRPALIERLVLEGLLTREQIDRAKQKRKGSRRTLGETLEVLDLLPRTALGEVASRALREDVCDLVASRTEGEFELTEGNPPPRTFDAEERHLKLAISTQSLLLEAARRSDMWTLIRQVIPSDSIHFFCNPELELPADFPELDGARSIVPELDGSHSVEEIVLKFPQSRFQAYTVLAELVKQRLVRAVTGQDLLEIARSSLPDEPKRARSLLARGLESEPQHRGLLELEAQLAESLRDRDAASVCHRTLAHLALEANDRDGGRHHWNEALRLTPKDPTTLERGLELALEDGRRGDALELGMQLVEVYRGPGLHRKSLETLERLDALNPGCRALATERARVHVAAGQVEEAIHSLLRASRTLLHRRQYGDARELYVEILDLDPQHAEASQRLDEIDSQAFARRSARRRRLFRTAATLLFLASVGAALIVEMRARVAFAEVNRSISNELLIEERQYSTVRERFESFCDAHPLSFTRWFDAQRQLESLELRESELRLGPVPPK